MSADRDRKAGNHRGVADQAMIPYAFWDKPEVTRALRSRDIGRLFALLQKYTGASQTQIGIACGMPQGKVSSIMRGKVQIEKFAVIERIAGGLNMPDHALVALGLAPSQEEENRKADDSGSLSRRPRKPNLLLRRIREQERHETRAEFAEAMRILAHEMGENVYPDGKYVAKLEQGIITFPRPLYRRILVQLCGRPINELGFAFPATTALAVPNSDDGQEAEIRDGVPPASWTNVRFRDAVMASGMEISELARRIGIDPKSVQRWIKRGTIPHPRHRWKACEILGREESQLWPGSLAAVTEEASDARESDLRPDSRQSPAVVELCGVLTDYGFRIGQFASPLAEGILTVAHLERDLEISFRAYQQSRFTAAASRVSMLLADAHRVMRECGEHERQKVFAILALSHQVAAAVLSKAGQPDIAWIAAERGMNYAEWSGRQIIRGSLIRSVAFALLSTGRLESAISLIESSAYSLEKEIARDHAGLSVYGTLFLAGSIAAARYGDGPKTAEYLREADRAAAVIGRDANHLWTAFGPTNVSIHRVNTAVELGDIQTVLDHGLSLNTNAVPTERRARYLLDVARAHSLTRNREDAIDALLTAERLAPEQVRQHYLTRKVITALMKNSATRSVELDKLAARVSAREPT